MPEHTWDSCVLSHRSGLAATNLGLDNDRYYFFQDVEGCIMTPAEHCHPIIFRMPTLRAARQGATFEQV